MAGEFNKQITNARNSMQEFRIPIQQNPAQVQGGRRMSAVYLQKAIVHGAGTKKNFTTITPEGIPEDLMGDENFVVERQNVLIEPRGQKNERARLPPFKPFKTISDEDNIHLLPGETGERARLNLLDTKVVTKADVDEVRNAYFKMKQKYPDLYRKQQPVETVVPEPAVSELPKKSGFFQKLFRKKSKAAPVPVEQPKPPVVEKEEEKVQPKPIEEKFDQQTKPSTKLSGGEKLVSKSSYSTSHSSNESGSSSSSSEESQSEVQQQYPYGYPYGYGQQQQQQYPYNPAYPYGFGPMQSSPCYNPCVDEIQYGCKKCLKDKKKCQASQKLFKKAQGLNFDFLPHDDLATEVTMTIEPDEPEPLQFAVENGIMPIICCYMPSSLAVSQQQQQQQSAVPFSGYPTTSYGNHSHGQSAYHQYASNSGSGDRSSYHQSQIANSNRTSGTSASFPQSYGNGSVGTQLT